MKEKLTVIILAAGSGIRFNSKIPKSFIKIGSKPIFWYSTHSFQSIEEVDAIYIVVSPDKMEYAKSIQKKYLNKITKLKSFITGGKTRQESVYNALKIIQTEGNCKFVAIHDAARPFIKPNLIKEILSLAVRTGGAASGIPVIDTIKLINDNDMITNHLKREDLVAIQTPQIFDFQKILKAYLLTKKKSLSFTDDTEVYSLINKKIGMVSGDKDLIKITYKEDLKTAKEILKRNKNLWK